MSGLLPENVDPARLARSGQVLHGVISAQRMNRLAGIVDAGDAVVEVSLGFTFDDGGQCLVEGEVSARVDLPCQRCLRMMPFPIRVCVRMAACRAGREDELPEGFDPLPTVNGRLNLFDLAEDEIILGLPIVAMHPLDSCPVDDEYRKDILVDDHDQQEETQRPFAGLAEMFASRQGKQD